MANSLVHDSDIQVHLPIDKFDLADLPDDLAKVKLDIERVIKGRLSGTFAPLTLAGWTSPNSTPEYIRAIGGRLAAALLYRLRLAQDDPDDIDYARRKYREAMDMLEMVATGAVTLVEVAEVVDTGRHLSDGHFNTLPEPVFTMDSQF